mgnify:CR=1 FL=1
MIDYKDCLVPVGVKAQQYVWVAYDTTSPYLPIAIADSAQALANKLGVHRCSVVGVVSRYRRGKIKHPRYMCIYIGGEDF